jgi:prepilin-type N-terminal cleavage/methylation domain-containing protein
MHYRRTGFTLIEVMVVIAIIAFLSMIAVPNFMKFLARAKRSEAYMNLSSLYIAQKAYWAEHGTYTTNLNGPGGLGWKPEGYTTGGNNERFYYTYGFADGKEGENLFTGKLNTPIPKSAGTTANAQTFIIAAVADIDGDGQPDVLTVDHLNDIKIVIDDTQ